MSKKLTALIVDDQVSICETLSGVLSDEGWQSLVAYSGESALAIYRREPVQVVFLDVWMKGLDGIETLQKMKEIKDDIPIVVMSGHGSIETAVKATKLGATDFLEKPISIEKIIKILEMASINQDPRVNLAEKNYELVGVSDFITNLQRQIKIISPRNSWVFITGENGTGKEIVARNIHLNSNRSLKPFVAVNCAAIPEDLIESELFGYKKGAFTNALASKKGKFEAAHEGTLFLDEIGDMSLKTQAKILRILQEQTFERLGDNDTIHIDVRVIAATNKNLQTEIAEGRFREDLFYRLNVIPLHMQPLFERKADISVLAEHFFKKMSLELKEPLKKLSEDAIEILKAYPWPGNIRELKNLIERICILAPDIIIPVKEIEAFLPNFKKTTPTTNLDENTLAPTLKEARNHFEKTFILRKLEENDWSVTKTAESINIERSNLHRKLRTFDIDLKRLK